MTFLRRPWCVLALLSVLAGAAFGSDQPIRPNIVLILADDLGWTGLGCFGSDFYETPSIDRLASQGMRFDRGYAPMMNCAPSRASIMSGQYTPRHQIFTVGNYQDKWKARNGNLKRFRLLQPTNRKSLSNDTLTIAEALKKAGYATAMFGKWHLGTGDQHPGKRGFDEAIESHGKHFGFATDPSVEYDPDQYLSDFLADRAIDFMDRSHAAGKPFFLYLPDFLVHAPLETKQKYLDHFAAKKPGRYQRSPAAGAMIMSLDDTVGRIMARLDELDIDDNTLLIFTSDNGGLSYQEDGPRDENTSNRPLRGRKGSEFEGGLRVPYIFRWPGRIPAGTACHEPIIGVDLYPTLLKVAGVKPPDQALDGVDLTPILLDRKAGLEQRELYWYLPVYSSFNRPCVVVRRGHWKLIHLLETGDCELYQTSKHIGETDNCVAEHPHVAHELDSLALKWIDAVNAPHMVSNPGYDPEWKLRRGSVNEGDRQPEI